MLKFLKKTFLFLFTFLTLWCVIFYVVKDNNTSTKQDIITEKVNQNVEPFRNQLETLNGKLDSYEQNRAADALGNLVEYLIKSEGERERKYNLITDNLKYRDNNEFIFIVESDGISKLYKASLISGYSNAFDIYIEKDSKFIFCYSPFNSMVTSDEDPSINSNNSEIHHVSPHDVSGYTRSDGTQVDGYHRGGSSGYERSNPDGNLSNNLRK